MRKLFPVLLLMGLLLSPGPALAAGTTIYVDGALAEDCLGRYAPATRSCAGGNATAYARIAGAAALAQAGDLVLIRGGTYREALIPARSGTAEKPLTVKAYPNEDAIITGPQLAPAIDISGKRYLVIEGLKVKDVRRWMYAVDAHHNVIRGNTFFNADDEHHSSKQGLFFQGATYNKVLQNHIEVSREDSLSLIRSDRNLIAGNAFVKARHTLWTIKCGNFNVLRNNYFHNERQKIGEIYDCDRVGFEHDITAFNATKYNLVEKNVFAFAPPSGRQAPFAGIQYAAQHGIIRQNLFYDIAGPALDLTLYPVEALHNVENRVYHNVFYGTQFAGVAFGRGETLSGNIFKNNILAGSRFVAHDNRWPWYSRELNGRYVQVMTGRIDGFVFWGNALFGGQGSPESYLIAYGSPQFGSQGAPRPLAAWQAEYPHLFRENIERDPMFVNEANRDFRLRPGSPLIDAGVFLTRTAGAGSGTRMRVEDVGYFFDGYGIPGESGDRIQLEGQREAVPLAGIDYASRTLILGRPLTWQAGQGVHLPFSGARPDIGAYEFAGGEAVEASPAGRSGPPSE